MGAREGRVRLLLCRACTGTHWTGQLIVLCLPSNPPSLHATRSTALLGDNEGAIRLVDVRAPAATALGAAHTLHARKLNTISIDPGQEQARGLLLALGVAHICLPAYSVLPLLWLAPSAPACPFSPVIPCNPPLTALLRSCLPPPRPTRP